jgi:hypothetical protein
VQCNPLPLGRGLIVKLERSGKPNGLRESVVSTVALLHLGKQYLLSQPLFQPCLQLVLACMGVRPDTDGLVAADGDPTIARPTTHSPVLLCRGVRKHYTDPEALFLRLPVVAPSDLNLEIGEFELAFPQRLTRFLAVSALVVERHFASMLVGVMR